MLNHLLSAVQVLHVHDRIEASARFFQQRVAEEFERGNDIRRKQSVSIVAPKSEELRRRVVVEN